MEPGSSLLHTQAPAPCPYSETDQSSPCPNPTSWISIFILSYHICLGLPSGLFPSGFPTKTLYAPLPHMLCVPCLSHSSWFDHSNNIWWAVQLIMQSSPLPHCFFPPRPKYPPQYSLLKHPQPMFLPQCKWPSFTPAQKNKQYYTSVTLHLYILG